MRDYFLKSEKALIIKVTALDKNYTSLISLNKPWPEEHALQKQNIIITWKQKGF